jgi:hypothetical protein
MVPVVWERELGIRRTRSESPPLCMHQRLADQGIGPALSLANRTPARRSSQPQRPWPVAACLLQNTQLTRGRWRGQSKPGHRPRRGRREVSVRAQLGRSQSPNRTQYGVPENHRPGGSCPVEKKKSRRMHVAHGSSAAEAGSPSPGRSCL